MFSVFLLQNWGFIMQIIDKEAKMRVTDTICFTLLIVSMIFIVNIDTRIETMPKEQEYVKLGHQILMLKKEILTIHKTLDIYEAAIEQNTDGLSAGDPFYNYYAPIDYGIESLCKKCH
jgi:hypothetical protein